MLSIMVHRLTKEVGREKVPFLDGKGLQHLIPVIKEFRKGGRNRCCEQWTTILPWKTQKKMM